MSAAVTYELSVTYHLNEGDSLSALDERVEHFCGAGERVASGAGFGQRDIHFIWPHQVDQDAIDNLHLFLEQDLKRPVQCLFEVWPDGDDAERIEKLTLSSVSEDF